MRRLAAMGHLAAIALLGLGPWVPRLDAQAMDGFACAVAVVPDQDGDGVEDIAVGDPNPRLDTEESGCVWIVSSRTGLTLRRYHPPTRDRWFGQSIAVLGAGDGRHSRLLVGSTMAYPEYSIREGLNRADNGAVYVVSLGGEPTQAISRRGVPRRFGLRIRAVPDCDGDGREDVLVASPGLGTGLESHGTVEIFGSTSLELLCRVEGPGWDPEFALDALVLASRELESERILVVTRRRNQTGARLVEATRILVGGSKPVTEPLYSVHGRPGETTFGNVLGDVGDVDGDTWSDFAVGAPELVVPRKADEPPTDSPRGRVLIVSGRNGTTLREFTLQDKTGMFGTGCCVASGAAWGKGRVLVVTVLGMVASSVDRDSLCVFDVDSGALLERIDLGNQGGSYVTIVHGDEKGQRLVTGRCDIDPEGWLGSLMIFEPGSTKLGEVVRRLDLILDGTK